MAEVLGQGGSGIVYDAAWGPRRVALKVLHARLIGTESARTQFLAEAQRLQQITHPSVVKVLAFGELPDGRPYLAMERLEGETLASVIARGALPLARCLELFGELCDAVAALHAQGLVHRDLKPENVFVVGDRHAVLLDFGIAKDIAAPASTTTQEGNVRGTPAYMAPERFFGQPAGPSTDVYELAVTLYMMLSGRLPWDHVADPEMRLSPRSLVELAPGVPEPLDIEIRRALSTRVQNRPASATALLAAVRAAAEGATDEPAAGSTARLRPGAHDEVTAPERTASAEHATPLAWAPTQAAPVASAQAPRRRTALVLGVTAVAIAGGATAWWRLRDRAAPSATTQIAAPIARVDDPWAPNAPRPPSTTEHASHFTLAAPPLDAASYRVEAAAAIARLPPSTHLAVTVQVAELRANTYTSRLIDSFAKTPKIAAVALMVPECVRGLFGDADWLAFGAPGLDAKNTGTLVLRGRWRKADVIACFGDAERHVTPDGANLIRINDVGWLDFLDDQTAYVSLTTQIAPDTLHAQMIKGRPAPHVRELLQRLPAERSLAIVADGAAKDDWSALSLPRGSDVFGTVLVGAETVRLDLAADPHDTAAAQTLVDKVQPELDQVFGKAATAATGQVTVRRDGTLVRLEGELTSLMLSIVTSAL